MTEYIEIGNRFRLLRAHLSQKKFAQKLGVSLRSYIRYETGERIPKGDILRRIASIMSVPTDWILTGQWTRERTDDELRDDIKRTLWLHGTTITDEEEERLIQHHKEEKRKSEEKMLGTGYQEAPHYFKSELMSAVIERVEYLFNKEKLSLPPPKKSKLIILLYEELIEDESKRAVLDSKIISIATGLAA